MPEVAQGVDKYVSQIRQFTLPPEFSNDPKPAESPKEEAKSPTGTVAEAPTTEAPKEVAKPEEAKAPTEGDPEKQSNRRFERRIDRAHRRAAEAQAKAEVLERELERLRTQSQPKVASTAPRMEDFTDVQEYAKAFAAHEKEQALKEYQSNQQKAQQEAQLKKVSEDWEAQVSKAQSKYDDWDEVVGDLKPTQPWSMATMKSENGTDIAHYLGTHEAEARKLMALDPVSQIIEIGKLSLKLSLPVEKPKQPSAAPKPINPVTPESKPSGEEIRADQPYEEYRKVGNRLFGRGRR